MLWYQEFVPPTSTASQDPRIRLEHSLAVRGGREVVSGVTAALNYLEPEAPVDISRTLNNSRAPLPSAACIQAKRYRRSLQVFPILHRYSSALPESAKPQPAEHF